MTRPEAERRASPRVNRSQCDWLLSTRLRPGRDVALLDLSGGGALVEGPVRLGPGARVELHLVAADGAHTLRGRVLRCWVCALDGDTGVRYRVALSFDQLFAAPEPVSLKQPSDSDASVSGVAVSPP